jgi:hypothetical protein
MNLIKLLDIKTKLAWFQADISHSTCFLILFDQFVVCLMYYGYDDDLALSLYECNFFNHIYIYHDIESQANICLLF